MCQKWHNCSYVLGNRKIQKNTHVANRKCTPKLGCRSCPWKEGESTELWMLIFPFTEVFCLTLTCLLLPSYLRVPLRELVLWRERILVREWKDLGSNPRPTSAWLKPGQGCDSHSSTPSAVKWGGQVDHWCLGTLQLCSLNFILKNIYILNSEKQCSFDLHMKF